MTLSEGWAAPPLASWLEECTELASQQFYNKPAMYHSEGGSIAFMGMLGKLFPEAQFLIVGVLGPNSNAHGKEPFAQKVSLIIPRSQRVLAHRL